MYGHTVHLHTDLKNTVKYCSVCSAGDIFCVFRIWVYYIVFCASIFYIFQVLAHRGSHWTTLQCVCQALWDHYCRLTVLVQRAAQFELPSLITGEQLHTTFTPLLVLASDLIMDMLNRLGVSVTYSCMHTCSCLLKNLK